MAIGAYIRDAVGDSCRGQNPNPDISGIGVRLSFYIQNVLLVVLVNRSWQDAPGALWTFIFTSFALTISAIIQASQQQLSLHQALTVGNLVWMANFGTFLSMASYSRHKATAEKSRREEHDKKRTTRVSMPNVQYFATIQTFFSMALTLYVWSTVDTFGNQDDCAPLVKYVAFFAADFPALKSGRDLGLATTSVLLVLYLFITVHETKAHLSRVKTRERNNDDPEAQQVELMPEFPVPEIPEIVITPASRRGTAEGASGISQPFTLGHAPSTSLSSTSSRSDGSCSRSPNRKRERRPKRPGPKLSRVDPMFVSLIAIHLLIFAYFVSVTELLLTRNPAADNSASQWGFGQIFAMMAIGPSLLSACEALQEHGFRRLHHHTRGGTGAVGNTLPRGRRRRGGTI